MGQAIFLRILPASPHQSHTALAKAFDHWIALGLTPLAIWILLSGLDDLFVAVVVLARRRGSFLWPADPDLEAAPERRIAILVPLWREHAVIGRMIEHNLSVLRYSRYDIFLGAYPNDELTQRAVSEAAARSPRVHPAICGRDGPTSKGDCLNWIYYHLEAYEAHNGVRFDVIVTHDAEDLMHPDSLRLINWFSRDFEMVQIPVLPLATPASEFTHGLYCDEFAEYQSKDIPARQILGSFLPSNGVGTGFARAALDRLAADQGGRICDPACLTEDYDAGYRLHRRGARQIFLPLRRDGAGPIATREYFPRRLRAAVRQRSRWVAGIALQGWQRHGWRAPLRDLYWLWRDRKGLAGNLLAPLANGIFLYAAMRWWSSGGAWHPEGPAWLPQLCALTLALSAVQIAWRTAASARIYGWRMGLLAPARSLWGNLVNGLATLAALRQFAAAAARGRGIAWNKTDHAYPLRAGAAAGRPRLGELLVRSHSLAPERLDEALRTRPASLRLGEYLVYRREVSEEQVYRALGAQSGIAVGLPPARDWNPRAVRALPLEAARRWRVVPYRIALGQIHLLTPEVPSEEMARDLARLCTLELRFRLVRPGEFEQVAQALEPMLRAS
jgi:adsorption protein B